MSGNTSHIVREKIFSHSTISLRQDGIIHIQFNDLVTIGLKESREINDTIGEFGSGKKMRVLMESALNTNFEKEAREFSASEEGHRYTLADALIAKSTAQSIFINFYLKINRPVGPTKSFTTLNAATDWLLALPERE